MNSTIYRFLAIGIFAVILLSVIGYARGYRLSLLNQSIVPTGILVASSRPDGGKIYIDGELHGATNSNISLPPGKYEVVIKKDGYVDWKKTLSIKGELVVKAEALLVPINPSLLPITSIGVDKAITSAHGNKILVFASNQSRLEQGIYLLDLGGGPLSLLESGLDLLVRRSLFPASFFTQNTSVTFSPDSDEILLTSTTSSRSQSYLIKLDENEPIPLEVGQSEQAIRTAWLAQENQNTLKLLSSFKKPLPTLAQNNFDILSFSPDDTKILYKVKKNIDLPVIIKPRLVSTNQTSEVRELVAGQTYVYDAEEDKNYRLSEVKNPLWYPDSAHLIAQEDKRIVMIDYDGSNKRTIYSGPFEKGFFAIGRDGRVLVLSNLNPEQNSLPDVYAISIK